MKSFKVHPINGIGPTLEVISASDVEFEWLKLAETTLIESANSDSESETSDLEKTDREVTRNT